jgi:hypothetical protein
MRLISILLCLLLVAKLGSSSCSATNFLGYDKDVASYAAKYATCSNLLFEFKD